MSEVSKTGQLGGGGEQESVDPALERLREQSRKNRAELQRRIEAGEIDPNPMQMWELGMFREEGVPIQRRRLKNQAIVVTYKELDQLNGLHLVLENGHPEFIDPESAEWFGPDDRLILYPQDLGDE